MADNWDRTMRDAETIFNAALERVDPFDMISRCMQVEGEDLVLRTSLTRRDIPSISMTVS